MILPTLMLVIVFITIVPKYNILTFIFIMTAFYWVGTARLIRSKLFQKVEEIMFMRQRQWEQSDLKNNIQGSTTKYKFNYNS